MRMRSKLVVAAVSLMASVGCNKTPEQDVTKAAEAQREANQQIAEVRAAGAAKVNTAQEEATKAQNDAHEAALQAQREAAEKAAATQEEVSKAQNDVVRKTGEAQTAANKTIRAANADMAKARTDLREWSQKEINEIDSAIDSARTKTADATAAQKAAFDEAMRDIQVKRAALRDQLATLETRPADGLSKFETRVHAEVDELKTRVKKMQSAL